MLGQYETRISKRNLSQIRGQHMTPSELIHFLEAGALYRSFADVLRAVYPGDDLAERLKAELVAQAETPPTAKELDSLRKNISNWLKGSAVPQKREQLFKICFALGLSEAETSRVLASASDTGIHYRNPQELVFAFALRTGLSYREARALDLEMSEIYRPAVEAGEKARTAQWKAREQAYHDRRTAARQQRQQRQRQGGWAETYMAPDAELPPDFFTRRISHRFERVTNREELRQFFLEVGTDLGQIHESAYEKFWRLLMTLQEPDDVILSDRGAETYSLDRVAEDYFRMHVPLTKNTAQFDVLQKTIKKNWPGATELQKMKSRKIDVSRKAMVLLFLITEDFLFSEDLDEIDGETDVPWLPLEKETARDRLETALSKLNLFLETYGMNQLDPGNPFDCLVIYALASPYEDDFLTDNFSNALQTLFPQDIAPTPG